MALRRAVRTPLRAQIPANGVIVRAPIVFVSNGSAGRGSKELHSSSVLKVGIMPESENPPPKQSEDSETPTVPTDITTTEFHERADEYLDELLSRLEEKQEISPDIDVEYSVMAPPPCIANSSS